MSTGRQEVNDLIKRQQEEVKQAQDQEASRKRDSKKVALQKGLTQPTGKNSTLKGDGRSGKFNKDNSEEWDPLTSHLYK